MGQKVIEMFGFKKYDIVRTLVETTGSDENDEEVTLPAGTLAIIDHIEHLGEKQGWAFTVVIGNKITNVFDEGDGMPEKKFFEPTGLTLARIKTSGFYSNAAFEHGEKEGNEPEIDDLRELFEVAFGMLSEEQKFDFFFNDTVQDILDKGDVFNEPEDEDIGDEACDRCNNPLGTDQIGLCDSCQEDDDES